MNKEQIAQLQSTLSEINSFLDGLQENFGSLHRILSSLEASETPSNPEPKKRGRPPKQKPVVQPQATPVAAPDVVVEDMLGLGKTDPELAERLKNRYKPFARSGSSLGPGVKVGTSKDIEYDRKTRVETTRRGHVSIEDE